MGPLDDAATGFSRWYGPWSPLDPGRGGRMLAGLTGPGGSVGGWSIRAFTGVARDHEDVDVSVLACDYRRCADTSATRGRRGATPPEFPPAE